MNKRYKLGPVSQIPFGEGRNFNIMDRKVAVFRTRDDGLYATQASCPHRSGPLADGLVGGTTLVCPLHEWSFDLASGRPLNGTCGISTYAVTRGDDDEIWLELPVGLEPHVEATLDAEE